MKQPPLVYLAAPYAHPDPTVMDTRYHAINRVVADLMLKGINVYSPITHNHPLACIGSLPRGWDFWQKFDLPMLAVCQKLLILQLDGWEKSVGVTAEGNFAANAGIVIEYMPAPPNAPRAVRDGFTMLTLSAYAIVHLHETGEISEGQARKLMNCPDVVSYRLIRERIEKEMHALLDKDLQVYTDFNVERAKKVTVVALDPPRIVEQGEAVFSPEQLNALAMNDTVREAVSQLQLKEREQLRP